MAEEVPVPDPHGHAEHAAHHHGPPTSFIRKYIFSINHKVIGIQYLLLAAFSVFVGMIMSVLMRLNLTWPDHKSPLLGSLFHTAAPAGQIAPEFYLSLVTMHRTLMVCFV